MFLKPHGFVMQPFGRTFFLVKRIMTRSEHGSFVQKKNHRFIRLRFWDIIRACSLEHDLDMLPNREQTEIGEKGINLSGVSSQCSCHPIFG